MAAALSRALKLPGKKGSELGEYDPLTQADSEDESEEDDLVLNYPRNGLSRDGCLGSGSSKLRGGRSGRMVAAEDEAQDDEDEWRERLPSKSRQDREGVKGAQYWSHSGRDRTGEDRGVGGPLGAAGLHGADAEEKKLKVKNAIRTAFFLVPLVCAMLLVLLCAFLIPCQKGALGNTQQWERELGDAEGRSAPALALCNVDGDPWDNVLLGVTEWSNDTFPAQGSKVHSVVALSAASGQVQWRKVTQEPVMHIQCGLQFSSQPSPVCLLIGQLVVTAVNGSTGKNLWSLPLKSIESQAVLLPDIQGDSVPDLLIATLPADESFDISLTLISGLTGTRLGQTVPFNLTAQGTLIGPLLHETPQGAYYILCGLGNVLAISLRDIYVRATRKLPASPTLRQKDAGWEALKSSNSSLVRIFREPERVEFLLPLVADFGNSLDTLSNLNSSRSGWLLVYGKSKLSALRQRDMSKEWTYNSPLIHSEPTPGHFNDDGVVDLFIQHSANGIMRAQVIDGANGNVLWTAEFVCPRLHLKTLAISTYAGLSAFVFWASEPIKAQKTNVTKATASPGVAAAEPFIRKLFLLHPVYPTILVELTTTTDTTVTSAVSYQEHQKDASYITISSRPTTDSEPGARIIRSVNLRSAIAKGQLVRLEEGNKTGAAIKPDMFEANKFFRRLTFKH